MNISKIKKVPMIAAFLCTCAFTGCAGSSLPPSAGHQNTTALAVLLNTNTGAETDSYTAELPGGNIDYAIYEQYGLLYDKESKCYTYNGSVVRFFNDPAVGAGFTNFFTGTVDIEAERDTDNKLIGIKECAADVYEKHTEKHEKINITPMSTDTAMEAGNEMANIDSLRDYESYGISYHAEDMHWYYDNQRICVFIDCEKAVVYLDDEGSICLSASRSNEQETTEINEISKEDAQTLLKNNNPGNSLSFTAEEN